MSKITRLIAVLFAATLTGCSTLQLKPTKAVLAQEPRDILGLGISYNWPTMDPEKLCEALAKAGCNATDIEFMGMTVSTMHGYRQGGAEALKPKYLALLKAARARNITVIVSVINDNMHIKKWGQSGVHDLAHWPAECERAAQIVLEAGPQCVWVQAVGETQTSQGRAYQAKWVPIFHQAGFRTINNSGSRPIHNGNCWTRAYHACKLSDLGNGANILLIPDCGTAIDQYTDGGNFNSGHTVNPGVASDYARRGRAAGRGVCIYTGTGIVDLDKQLPAIAAIGGVR